MLANFMFEPAAPPIELCCGDVFSLKNTLDCGQCFRWEEQEDGSFCGVVGKRYVKVWQKRDIIKLQTCSQTSTDRAFWAHYFALDVDYEEIEAKLKLNKVLNLAFDFSPGIRILAQDPWEALISFIVSQNNNIARIKKIVKLLCEVAGFEFAPGIFAFPTPEQLANLDDPGFDAIRSGFRQKYIKDAANMVATGKASLERIAQLSSKEALFELQQIKGVGPKVAACVLLYGLGRLDVVPVDVWVKRGLVDLLPGGWPKNLRGFEGIAAQYLYNYMRLNKTIRGEWG